MTTLHCLECDHAWDATATPVCPRCLASRWRALPDFITRKHDPRALPFVHDTYRSVVTYRFVEEKDRFIDYASHNGIWLYDTHYEQFVHFTPDPLDCIPGVGVPAGAESPEHGLDSMMIADAHGEAHVFAVERKMTEAQIRAGEFEALRPCREDGCDNLQVPGDERCAGHAGFAAMPESCTSTTP